MTTDTHPKAAYRPKIDDRRTPCSHRRYRQRLGYDSPQYGHHDKPYNHRCRYRVRTLLQDMLKKCADRTYNRVSVDGDTSVCDTVLMLANGMSGVKHRFHGYGAFFDALVDVCTKLAKQLAADGEGATKLMSINVTSAPDDASAKLIANAIAKSPLCKTAAFGEDANWGRILTAAGYSGADFDPAKCRLIYRRPFGIRPRRRNSIRRRRGGQDTRRSRSGVLI